MKKAVWYNISLKRSREVAKPFGGCMSMSAGTYAHDEEGAIKHIKKTHGKYGWTPVKIWGIGEEPRRVS